MFPKLSGIVILLTLVVAPLCAKEEFRTLTSNEGEEIRAKILKADGEHVWIEREDGLRFQLPLNRLSENDRKEVAEWRRREGALPPDAIRIGASRLHDGPQQTRYDPVRITRSDGQVRWDYRGIEHVTRNVGYVVSLDNRRPESIAGLRAEYRIFTSAGEKRLIVSAEGEEKLDEISAWQKVEFKTRTVETSKTKHRYSSEPYSNQKTDLAGIWVKIFQDDIFVTEFAMPTSLIQNENWAGVATARP